MGFVKAHAYARCGVRVGTNSHTRQAPTSHRLSLRRSSTLLSSHAPFLGIEHGPFRVGNPDEKDSRLDNAGNSALSATALIQTTAGRVEATGAPRRCRPFEEMRACRITSQERSAGSRRGGYRTASCVSASVDC